MYPLKASPKNPQKAMCGMYNVVSTKYDTFTDKQTTGKTWK